MLAKAIISGAEDLLMFLCCIRCNRHERIRQDGDQNDTIHELDTWTIFEVFTTYTTRK